MITRSTFYKVIAAALCIALTLSLTPPPALALLFGVGVAHAASPEVNPIPELMGGANSPMAQALQASLPPELAQQLTGMGALGPDGEPNGMLVDVGAMQAMAQNEAASLAAPISISRMQSAFRAADAISGTLVITFTVSNNQPPSIPLPQLSPSATITDTINAVSAIDFSKDPNVIRNVLVADSLTSYATFVSSSPMPDHSEAQYAWNLGDIPPLGSITATLKISVPTSIADFIDLDTGATAWGTLQGRAVFASTAPATLAPETIGGEPIGDWLMWTVDADYYDEYMVTKSAELGNDWAPMFAYVRSLGYESYKGSLRGTRGTLWSEAGNSLDQASLLIAMLRGSGIPSRYRHGALSTARAQELILSMFPEPTSVIGHIPPGTEVADPANDPQLLEETIDHWWVEAYIPGLGWTNLDPTFANAAPGQTFYASLATDGTDRIAEVPDSLRHKVTMTVKIEKYHPLTPGNNGLSYSYPLSHTFNTVELTGDPVAFGHLVNTESQTGMVFFWVQHTYIPYFVVGDSETTHVGQAFQELLSNFPFGTFMVTGEWLLFDVRDADGNIKHSEREIADRVGFANRQGQFPPVTMGSTGEPLFTVLDVFTFIIQSGRVPQSVTLQQGQKMREAFGNLNATFPTSSTQQTDPATAAQQTRLIAKLLPVALANFGYTYIYRADSVFDATARYSLAEAYLNSPNILGVNSRIISNTVNIEFDLHKISSQIIASPGQNKIITYSLNMLKGISDNGIEDLTLRAINPNAQVKTTFNILKTAIDAGIPVKAISIDNLDELAQLEISNEAKLRIQNAIYQGEGNLVIMVPEQPVQIGQDTTTAWLEFNRETGELGSMMENGLRSGTISYAERAKYNYLLASFLRGFVVGLIYQIVLNFASKISTTIAIIAIWLDAFGAILAWTSDLVCGGRGIGQAPCMAGWAIGAAVANTIDTLIDPPLPAVYLETTPRTVTQGLGPIQQAIGPLPPNTFTRDVTASLETAAVSFDSFELASWAPGAAVYPFQFNSLAASNTTLFDNNGELLVSNANLYVIPAQSNVTILSQPFTGSASTSGQTGQAFYAPALPGLGAGTNWLTYTAKLTSTQPYTLTLYDAIVTVNGTDVYTGNFTLVTTSTTTITGSGHTAAPNFAPALSGQAQDAHLMIGPATGTFLVGGQPVDASNGLAIAGYTGPITITEATSTTDHIELSGDASFFTLAVSPTTSVVDPNTPVNFNALISANFTDTYTVTVQAPQGWNVEIGANGLVTATPPLGTESSDYAILVTAQSGQYPDLFASAVHTVTTTAYQGMVMSVEYDELITVPMGQIINPEALPGDINDGRAQVPGAAYTVNITNTSTTSHTFFVQIDPTFPLDWLILSSAECAGAWPCAPTTTLSLPAGGVGQIGLYISPTQAMSLPPATTYPFTVTATMLQAPSLSQQQGAIFVMPAIAFNYLQANPTLVYASPNISATFDLALTNVGNAAGVFDVNITLPITTWVGAAPYSATLAAGESDKRAVVFTPTNAALGSHENIIIASPAPGTAYTQTDYVAVRIAGPCVLKTQNTIRAATQLDDTQLAALLQNLTLQLGRWELDETNLTLQARVVAALNDVIAHLHTHYPQIDTSGLEALAAAPTVAGFCAPIAALQDDLTTIAQRHVTAAFAPSLAATLLNQAVPYTLTLRNHGTLTTTYAVTLTGLPAGWASWTNQSVNLAPGDAAGLPVIITPTVFSYRSFGAQVQAVEDDFIQAQATAGLNAVDAFVRILAVTPTPSFVETGVSSTTLSIRVANIANIYQQANAHAQILAPTGSPTWTSDIPLTIRTGAAATYTLATIDTSGWAEGVYTVSVELLDEADNLIPYGSAYAYLGVGQALQLSRAVQPAVVPPGTVTVTTIITSRIRQKGFMGEQTETYTGQLAPAPSAQIDVEYNHSDPSDALDGDDDHQALPHDLTVDQSAQTAYGLAVSHDNAGHRREKAREARFEQADWKANLPVPAAPRGPEANPGIYRLENNTSTLVYAGTWATNVTLARASAGTVARSLTAGSTVTTSFNGEWVGVGFVTNNSYGYAEVFIDGTSQGVIDTYSSAENLASYYYAPMSGTHTISITVLGSHNGFSSNNYVSVDYIDVWDGAPMPSGTFEQDNPRIYRSNNWSSASNAVASGGTYYYHDSRQSNAWFPFTGDSLTYHAIATSSGDKVELLIDGVSQGYFDLYNSTLITRTFAFSLTNGPHVFQVSAYRGRATVDAFTTPGAPPFYQPPVRTGVVRYEEDDPALRYNGVPFRQTASTWSLVTLPQASSAWAARSETLSHTISLTFTGTWVGVGLLTEQDAGLVRVSIDGVKQDDLDTYDKLDATLSRYYSGLSASVHTLTLTILGQRNPNSSNNRVYLDYIDVWDGSSMPQGVFEQDDMRVYRSSNWGTVSSAIASGGSYYRNGSNLWFPFTGDSLTYQAIASTAGDKVELLIDGISQGRFDLYSLTTITRTFAFSLTNGPHIFQLSAYRGQATADAFTTPGAPPFYQPPVRSGVVRYEEDDPALRYNGVPFRQTASTWSLVTLPQASSDWAARSETLSHTISLTFTGTWVGVGLLTEQDAGLVRVSIDGFKQDDLDTYDKLDATLSRYYSGLSAGDHTLTLAVLAQRNPNSSNNRVYLDYIDVWDGSSMPQGVFEQDDMRVYRSSNWGTVSSAIASGGSYYRNGSNLWFPFTGDSLTYQAIASTDGNQVELLIDGVSQGRFSLYNLTTITRTFAFSLANGPHVFQLSAYRGQATADAFTTPGAPPFYQPPVRSGVVRYEEDDPALRYNGVPFRQTASTWSLVASPQASSAWAARSETLSHTISLTFTGTWVGVGLLTEQDAGLVRVSIDGFKQDDLDTYDKFDATLSRYYSGLSAGAHTLTLTILGQRNPFSSLNRVYLDYIDVWDGSSMPQGVFEQDDARAYRSSNWGTLNNTIASGGSYYRNGSNLWFPFTGDSLTYQAIASTDGNQVELLIDGISQGHFSLYNPTLITRTYAFSLTNGPHVFQLSAYRGQATADAFSAPGAPPFYQPPARIGLVRYEENDPALLYNGVPFRQTASTWAMGGIAKASSGYAAWSRTLSDTISLTFEGRWASIGFRTNTNAGMALVSIDGVSQGVIDTYSNPENVTSYIYPDLLTGTHTITLTVLAQHNPSSSDNLIYLDYIDVWDGAEFAPGRLEADRVSGSEQRVYFSDGWNHYNLAAASGGMYVEDIVDGRNLWFLFTGDSVNYLAISHPTLGRAQVFIDNNDYGVITLTYPFVASPLAFQYSGLGAGPHVLRLLGITNARADAFEAPAADFVGAPMVEWYDTTPAGGSHGVATTPAVGDLDGDDIVEIVVSSSDGNLYVYRGDGADAGGGSPLLWQHAITGSEPDSPALADLDGVPGAEIIVGGDGNSLYAFRADGTLWWRNTSVHPDWGGTAIANLDDDELPEIAVAASTGLHVVEPNGQVAWTYALYDSSPPILADLNGDGDMDILTAKNSTLYLFDYNKGITPTLVWQRTFTTSLEGRGAPAVADIDGLQPGGDPGPEIAIVSNGYIHVVDADGTVLWSYPTPPGGAPGGVSIADTDGDGEVEIIASMQVPNPGYAPGRIYVLNADGSLLWEAMAQDSTSANSVSVHDFDGDRDWEVVWNGANQGLTIYDGATGAILYNEPSINSQTRKDFPIVADVDRDNHVEIVTGDTEGIYVIGHDAAWAPSRPLWNEYNYHVTNIADDLSVPPIEPDSWVVHNTYRTQTPVLDPAPVYNIDITHTVMLSGMAVLTNTFSLSPDTPFPAYHWYYRQYWYQMPRAIHFDASLPGMQAGEVRQISQGTGVYYRLFSGGNRITLPPLYVEAAHIIAIAPPTITVNPGSAARYTVTLYNPAQAAQTYTLTVGGLPGDFATPASVIAIPANTTLTRTLLITTPANGDLGTFNLAAYVQTDSGGTDTAPAKLALADLLKLRIEPPLLFTGYGRAVTYTLTLTNNDDVARQFALGASGLEEAQITMPASLTLAAHQAVTASLVVTAYQPQGLYPFQVEASTALASSYLRASDGAILSVLNEPGVDISLVPSAATAGQASPAFFAVVVTNTGSLADGYDLSASLPAGWSYEFRANGNPLAHLDLTPYIFNAASLQLVVFPPDGIPAASYPISVTAMSNLNASVSASDDGLVDVSLRGVTVQITPHSVTMDPLDSYTWEVLVTNTGDQADTFDLVAGGIVSSTAQFDLNPVSLSAGQSTIVHLIAGDLNFALVETYPFAVTAYSQNDPNILGYDIAEVSFLGYEGVTLSITPTLIVLTDTLTAHYLVFITNTGNVDTIFTLAVNANPSLGLALEVDELYIPPHMTAGILLTARAKMAGTYLITASAASTTSAAQDEGTATLVVVPGGELQANLGILKQDSPDPVLTGAILTYTLLYGNIGVLGAQEVYITDTMPVELSFGGIASTNPPLPDPIQNGQQLVWHLSALPSSGGGVIVFTATVNAGISGTITNTVVITSSTPDSNLTDNYAAASTVVTTTLPPPSTDLAVTKSDSPDPVQAGSTLTYTLLYTNAGPTDAQHVLLLDTLPDGVSFVGVVSINPPLFGPTQTGQLLAWYTPTLPMDDEGSVVFTVAVHPNMSGTVTNTTTITTTTPDDNPADNSDTESTVVTPIVIPPIADLSIAKLDSPDPVQAGAVLTYTLLYTNAGPANAFTVFITDSLPAQVSFGGVVSTQPPLATPVQNGQTLVWQMPTLAAQAGGRIILTTTVEPGFEGTLTNTVLIASASPDDTPGNNSDAEPTTAMLVIIPATITGTVFEDANSNQTQDPGELGLSGVQVSLDQALTATTNLSGAYTLSTVLPGRHTLIQSDLPGYTSTTPNSVVITVSLGGSYQVNFGDKLIEPTLCLSDTHEQDDSPAAAHSLGLGVTATLNFCDDAADWLTFTAQANEVYTITTLAWDQRTDTILALYDTDGSTLLAVNDDYVGAPHFSSRIVWQATANGTYFVRVSNRGDLTGNQTGYDVRIDSTAGPSPLLLFLPLVCKGETSSAAMQPNTILAPLGVITHTLPDSFEVDDTWQQAQPILPGAVQTHTFDSPTASFAPDKDYVQFAAPIYSELVFTVLSSSHTSPTLELYDPDGNPLIEQGHWLTGSLALTWQVPDARTYFLAAVDANAILPATYTLLLQLNPARQLYLPIVLRNY